MSKRDAKPVEVLIGQVPKDRGVDVALGKTLSVLGHAERFKPVRIVVRPFMGVMMSISLGRKYHMVLVKAASARPRTLALRLRRHKLIMKPVHLGRKVFAFGKVQALMPGMYSQTGLRSRHQLHRTTTSGFTCVLPT